MTWRPPKLHRVTIEMLRPAIVGVPADFLQNALGEDALAVVERAAEVLVVPLDDVVFDDATLHVQAFSDSRKAQARLARAHDGAWVGDAVCEKPAAGGGEAIEVWSRPGRQLCLGKVDPDGSMREARIKPYRLPVPLLEGQMAEIEYVDYYAVDSADGTMGCIGHRVIAIRAVNGG